MNVFLTGASGFIGQSLIVNLQYNHSIIRALVRNVHSLNASQNLEVISCDEFYKKENSNNYLANINCVIHLAARVHLIDKDARDTQNVNVNLAIKLAKNAAKAGVKRFIFISSIKVNGEFTREGQAFSEINGSKSKDPYGRSKYEAEKGLLEIAKNSGMEVVIIRPPLVYGPGVKANFASLIRLAKKGVPLPLGAINNKRSLVAIDNLVDFISLCADRERSPQAANQVFVISDDADVSTTELLRKIAKAYDKKQWLIPVPVGLMKFAAKLLGKSEQAGRVFGNLQVDCSKAKDLLGWKPVITMDEQLKKMADAER